MPLALLGRGRLLCPILLLCVGCAGAPAAPPEVLAAHLCFEQVRLFDGLRDRGVVDVRVQSGRVAAVGPGACEGARGERVAGRGRTLLPGLIDAHSHNGGRSLEIQAAFGVTTTIDMAAKATWATEMREEQRSVHAGSEALLRADLVSPGPPATVQGATARSTASRCRPSTARRTWRPGCETARPRAPTS